MKFSAYYGPTFIGFAHTKMGIIKKARGYVKDRNKEQPLRGCKLERVRFRGPKGEFRIKP